MILNQQETAEALPWMGLIDCLDKIITQTVNSPVHTTTTRF
jgi:hypothetical protein